MSRGQVDEISAKELTSNSKARQWSRVQLNKAKDLYKRFA
jgi:hypothetical protein